MQTYYDNFDDKASICSSYCIDASELEDADIIYAMYSYENYEGRSLVIFKKDNELYEVHGSHCSCNGLEDQWSPEVTSLIALLDRPNIPDEAKLNLKIHCKNLLCFL